MAASGAIAMWVVRSNPGGFLRTCLLRTLTGIPCPACGTTRTMSDLFAGRIGAALGSNPLAAALAIFACLSAIASLAILPWADRVHLPRIPSRRVLVWIAVALVLVNWMYLIAVSHR